MNMGLKMNKHCLHKAQHWEGLVCCKCITGHIDGRPDGNNKTCKGSYVFLNNHESYVRSGNPQVNVTWKVIENVKLSNGAIVIGGKWEIKDCQIQ